MKPSSRYQEMYDIGLKRARQLIRSNRYSKLTENYFTPLINSINAEFKQQINDVESSSATLVEYNDNIKMVVQETKLKMINMIDDRAEELLRAAPRPTSRTVMKKKKPMPTKTKLDAIASRYTHAQIEDLFDECKLIMIEDGQSAPSHGDEIHPDTIQCALDNLYSHKVITVGVQNRLRKRVEALPRDTTGMGISQTTSRNKSSKQTGVKPNQINKPEPRTKLSKLKQPNPVITLNPQGISQEGTDASFANCIQIHFKDGTRFEIVPMEDKSCLSIVSMNTKSLSEFTIVKPVSGNHVEIHTDKRK